MHDILNDPLLLFKWTKTFEYKWEIVLFVFVEQFDHRNEIIYGTSVAFEST